MKKSQILGFFIIYVNLSILKISSKSGTCIPEPVDKYYFKEAWNFQDKD